MEIGVEVCFSEDAAASEEKIPQKTPTSLSDVVMDIQEEPVEVTPPSNSGQMSGDHLVAPEETPSLSPEAVAMETDEVCLPTTSESPDSTSSDEHSGR